eukprot:11326774-Alexandrium_andersonii.AAC.1
MLAPDTAANVPRLTRATCARNRPKLTAAVVGGILICYAPVGVVKHVFSQPAAEFAWKRQKGPTMAKPT